MNKVTDTKCPPKDFSVYLRGTQVSQLQAGVLVSLSFFLLQELSSQIMLKTAAGCIGIKHEPKINHKMQERSFQKCNIFRLPMSQLNFKVPMKLNLGCCFVVSHERPFNTEKNAIYRFSTSLLVPEF